MDDETVIYVMLSLYFYHIMPESARKINRRDAYLRTIVITYNRNDSVYKRCDLEG